MEYLVKISKKARIMKLKRRNMKKTDSDIQYAIWSIDRYGVLVLRIRSIDQYGVLGLRIRSIDQYGGVSADVDRAYSSNSGNGLEFFKVFRYGELMSESVNFLKLFVYASKHVLFSIFCPMLDNYCK
ncbi:hypothetical protein Tco_0104399 [Tanacetum coccineum]